MKNVFKLSLTLFLRTILVCLLSFMAVITLTVIGSSEGYVNPVISVVFGVFYFIALLYFFIYSAWDEGKKDSNRVAIGQSKEMIYKGFLSAAIVVVPIITIFILTHVFGDYQNDIMNILNIIKLIFMWAGAYFTVPFTGGVSTTTIEPGAETDPTTAIIMTSILCGVYVASWIGSGVGYIFGYKKISFIPKLMTTFFGVDYKQKN